MPPLARNPSRYGELAPGTALAANPPPALAVQGSRHIKLERHPTFAQLEIDRARPRSMPTFGQDESEDEAHGEALHAESERQATRSWSLSGGFREASFKKQPPGAQLRRQPSALGFAAVLGVSGWSEHDAEEVEVGPRLRHCTRRRRRTRAAPRSTS